MATPTPLANVTSTLLTRLTTFTPTLTATAGEILTLSVAATAPPRRAAAQSILDKGASAPNVYSPTDPIRIFIIQAVIIVGLSRLLAWPLAKIRQPKVISEVIGGIILGPSIMGRVPGFTRNIFPPVSIPNLTLVANIGLVLFLFLVGLEADLSVFKKNAKSAISVSLAGLIIPFGAGAAVSYGVYHKFVNTEEVDFGIFLLFIGTAMAITAFPVLARILIELKLLSDPVGLTTLAAGVGNDVIGWVLLALSVALANAGSGVTTVYILLVGAGLVLLLHFIVRPLYAYVCRRTGSFENGPTHGMMMLTLFLVFAVAFITDIIGVHAIFGSFLVGIVVIPRHPGFGAAITEKLEDLISILFIPIYFTLSGLKTDLGLLNSGAIWGYVVCVCIVAFASKFLSSAITAKLTGFALRESCAIGSLMACKGLVELIVLNIGLQAGILNNSVFAMFVVMALVTTFATTPLVLAFYPESYRLSKLAQANAAANQHKGDGHGHDGGKDGGDSQGSTSPTAAAGEKDEQYFRRRFVVVLERLESLPAMMSFVKLLQPAQTGASSSSAVNHKAESSSGSEGYEIEERSRKSHDARSTPEHALPTLDSSDEKNGINMSTSAKSSSNSSNGLSLDIFRLLALSDRTSALLRASSDSEVTKRADSILNIFSAFASLVSIPHTTSMAIVLTEEYADSVTTHAAEKYADMLVVPWAAGMSMDTEEDAGPTRNPLESLFGQTQAMIERSPLYASFVRKVLIDSHSDVGLFLDRGSYRSSSTTPDALDLAGAIAGGGVNHLYLPFHGGPDDRAALDFVVQLVANNSGMTATVARFVKVAPDAGNDLGKSSSAGYASEAAGSTSPLVAHHQFTIGQSGGNGGVQDTVYQGGAQGTQHRLASDTADNLALARYFPSALLENTEEESSSAATPLLPHAIARITFVTISTATPLKATLTKLASLSPSISKESILVVAGRSRRSAPSHRVELEQQLKEKVAGATSHGMQSLGIAASSEVRKTLGDVGSSLVVSGEAGSVLIVQSAVKGQAYLKARKGKSV